MMKNDAIRNTFKRNITRLLREKGATQKELAAAIGVSPATVSSWVQGKKLPRMDKADQICRFFNVPRETLLAVEVTLTGDTRRQVTPPDGARLAAILRQLQTDINKAIDAAVFAALHGDGYTATGEWSLDRQAVENGSGNSGTA